MKKVWKILGAAALIAGLTPYRTEHNLETDEKTYRALLWRATSQPHPQREDKRQVSVQVGFQNPLDHTEEEARMFADELACDLTSAGESPAEDTNIHL